MNSFANGKDTKSERREENQGLYQHLGLGSE